MNIKYKKLISSILLASLLFNNQIGVYSKEKENKPVVNSVLTKNDKKEYNHFRLSNVASNYNNLITNKVQHAINEAKMEDIKEKNFNDLNNMIEQITSEYSDKDVSVYYKDLNSDMEYSYNTDFVYQNASLKKVPMYLYYYTLAAEGKIDLNQELTYTKEDKYGGAGVIQLDEIGSTYTIQDLLTKSISYSDNIAFLMLKRTVDINDYNQFINNIGGDISYYEYTIKNAASHMKYLNIFIENNPEYSNQIMSDFTNTIYNDKIPAGLPTDTKVAHKIGCLNTSFHDSAIVFDEHPFILIIMSENGKRTDEEINKLFKKITEGVYTTHENLNKNFDELNSINYNTRKTR